MTQGPALPPARGVEGKGGGLLFLTHTAVLQKMAGTVLPCSRPWGWLTCNPLPQQAGPTLLCCPGETQGLFRVLQQVRDRQLSGSHDPGASSPICQRWREAREAEDTAPSLMPLRGRQVAGPALLYSHPRGWLTHNSCSEGQLYCTSWVHRVRSPALPLSRAALPTMPPDVVLRFVYCFVS
jgi:hypothetical protein